MSKAQANTTTATQAQPPQYELTEDAYINDMIYKTGETITYDGIPGPHMIPLNAAAEAQCEKYNAQMQPSDPIKDLTMIGPGATVLQSVHNRG